MKVVIPVAGESRRTRDISDIPKCMLKLGDRSILELQMEYFVRRWGLRDFVVVIGYKGDVVINECFEFRNRLTPVGTSPVNIWFAYQDQRLGDGHAVLQAKKYAYDDEILLCWGDHVIEGDFGSLEDDTAWLIKGVSEPQRFGVVNVNSFGEIDRITEKPEKPESDVVLSGVYYFANSKLIFDGLEMMGYTPHSKEIYFTNFMGLYLLFGLVLKPRYLTRWVDCGTSESYLAAVDKWPDGGYL